MKTYLLMIMTTFILVLGGCTSVPLLSNPEPAPRPESRPADTRYVDILSELNATGCDVTSFELAERNKTLDLKIACK